MLLDQQFHRTDPGAVVLIAERGNIVYRNAVGMANIELDVVMRPNMVFEVGSITKQFTAVAVLLLAERGQLKLHDPIAKYLPDFPTRGFDVTIHHLLTNTSGLGDYMQLLDWEKHYDSSPSTFIQWFANQPREFAPGEAWGYNNTSYYILGHIIEVVSGYSYEEFVQRNLFVPAGMYYSSFRDDKKTVKNRASGYQKVDGQFVNTGYSKITSPYAAGALMTTADDMFRWHRALFGYRIVKEETLDKAFENYQLANGDFIQYGYGWAIREVNGSTSYEHPGGIWGFAANEIYLPREDVYLVMLTNCECSPPQDILVKMAATTIGKPYERTKTRLDDSEILDYVGLYAFDDGSERAITFENGRLFSQRTGGLKYEIFPYAKAKFFFEDSFTTLEFIRNNSGEVVEVTSRSRSRWEHAKRTQESPIKREIRLDASVMDRYVGIYELKPNLYITVTNEGGRLMTQATGQEKYEVYPQSQTRFFFKVVLADLEFVTENGNVTKLVLHQGPESVEAVRVR